MVKSKYFPLAFEITAADMCS